jgi:hypothetical protein
MKTGGKNGGRRGRRHQKALDKIEREQLRQERAVENEKKERAQALARIIPRALRWCKLSEIGIVFVVDNRVCNYRSASIDAKTYFSAEGEVTMSFGERIVRTQEWAAISLIRLKHLATIRRFEVYKPKNDMLILAETIAGKHDDIYR